MRVELTTQDLLDAGACESGIQHFKWLTGGRLNLKWTKLHSVWLIRSPMRDDYLWAVSRKLLPLDLSGADLSGADLSRADLSGADLSRANLSRANLSGADLSRSDLSRANLSRANLSGADLSRSDLSGAYLFGANLSRADLSMANLDGAYLGLASAPAGWSNKNGYAVRGA